MKKIIVLLLACSFTMIVLGQNWAPTGATWHYEIVYPFSSQLSFVKYESVGDTNILSNSCKIITATGGTTVLGFLIGNSDTAYTYEDDGKIYVFDPSNNGFSLIYNFAADPGSTWTTTWDTCNFERSISSTDSIDINGITLKTLSFGSLKIIEGIGGERTLFHGLGLVNCKPPDTIIYEIPFIQRLRCYEDSIIGFYNTGISISCDYVTGIKDTKDSGSNIGIFPNPTSGKFQIKNSNSNEDFISVEIFNSFGKNIMEFETSEDLTPIDLSEKPKGVYLIRIKSSLEVFSEKIIVQ